MNKMGRIRDFADQLIRQKRLVRSIQNILLVTFVSLSIGIISALPLRFYMGITFVYPLIILFAVIVLSFIYGFLGIENEKEVLKEADFKLLLNEKLSAAYQFGDSANPYSSLLIDEASQIIGKVNVKDVYQVRFSKRDPFQPLLLALFLFLWMGSFTFLRISDETQAAGDMLVDTSLKIDAVNSGNKDKDIEDIADEYKKLGQKIQEQFMNEQSIENEIEKLSRKLERKIEELSRESVDKESQTLDEDPESELYQLTRKRELSDDLNSILESFMKTFSLTPDGVPGGVRKKEGGETGDSNQQSFSLEESVPEGEIESTDEAPGETGTGEETSEIEEGDSSVIQDTLEDGGENNPKPSTGDGIKDDEASGTENSPSLQERGMEEEMTASNTLGSSEPDDDSDIPPWKEEQQSGEFDDDENIRGELNEGDQMKSFIRALPHIVEPTLEEREIIYFYRNQLENAVEKEILPEGYQILIRDYFLGIGVLNE